MYIFFPQKKRQKKTEKKIKVCISREAVLLLAPSIYFYVAIKGNLDFNINHISIGCV